MFVLLLDVVTKVLVSGFVLILSFWCWFRWKHWDFIQAAKKLPCTVKPLPILGHLLFVIKGWEAYTKFSIETCSIAAVSKGLHNMCIWLGPLPVVMIHKLEDVQKILTIPCTSEKAHEYDYLTYAGGNGLLTAPGHIWKLTRRHISPLFNSLNVEQLMAVFNSNSRELVADLAEHVDGEPVDMLHPAMSVALKTVCQIIFGTEVKVNTKSKIFKDLMRAMEIVPQVFVRRLANPFLRIEFIFNIFYRKEIKEIQRALKEFTKSSFKEAKVTNVRTCNDGINEETDDRSSVIITGGGINLIDVYTELRKKYPQFTEKDLEYEMATLYCTGTDTIGLAVSSCLLAIGKYHDIQDRVYEEINAVVGPDDDVTMDYISRMQYLDQVYKETLRWSITVPYVLRRTIEDLKLSDCTIPAGYTVKTCLIGPHMDPKIYPNPRKFDPGRFSPGNSSTLTKNAFIPFSSGGRMCIAKTYSEHLVKTMLVHILRRYRVSTDMDIYNLKKSHAVTLVNSDGYLLKFSNRN